jgi:hypothetical protein
VIIAEKREAGYDPEYWVTDGKDDLYLLTMSGQRKVARLLDIVGLIGEPLGSGSYKRWANRSTQSADFMTSLLLGA